MSNKNSRKLQLFIDGKFTDAVDKNYFPVVSPVNNQEYTLVAKAGTDDVDRAANAAHHAFKGSWPRMLPFDRGRVLQQIADHIRERREEIATAETISGG